MMFAAVSASTTPSRVNNTSIMTGNVSSSISITPVQPTVVRTSVRLPATVRTASPAIDPTTGIAPDAANFTARIDRLSARAAIEF